MDRFVNLIRPLPCFDPCERGRSPFVLITKGRDDKPYLRYDVSINDGINPFFLFFFFFTEPYTIKSYEIWSLYSKKEYVSAPTEISIEKFTIQIYNCIITFFRNLPSSTIHEPHMLRLTTSNNRNVGPLIFLG